MINGLRTSKLFLALAALVVLASTIALPLSSSITHSLAASASSQASWNIVPSPNGNTSSGNTIQKLSVVSSNDIWALGSYTDTSNNYQPLIEHFDGTSWSIATALSVSSGYLASLSAISSSDIWAVGYTLDASTGVKQTLIMHFDGTNWTTIPSPNPATVGNNTLSSVQAISTNDVWAVGYSDNHALTLHWDGTNWTSIANPDPPTGIGSYGNALTTVTATSTNDVWATGYTWHSETIDSYQTVLIEHWDGNSWTKSYDSIVGNFAGNFDALNSITAISSSDVWAAGVNYSSSYPIGSNGPLVMHYDGTNWNVVVDQNSSYGPNTPNSIEPGGLSSISAASSNDIWAVGWGNTADYTAILHYDGTNWTVIPGADLTSNGADNGQLFAVSAISSDNVWTAGSRVSGAGGVNETLIEQYASSPSPTPSPTLSPSPSPSPSPTPSVTVQKVWTADGNNNVNTSFELGDTIHYRMRVNNTNGTAVTATFTFVATGPQQIFTWSGSQSIASGTSTITKSSTVPNTAPAGTYTLTVTVTYNGISSQGQILFTITNRYAVSVNVTPPSGIVGVSANMDIWKPNLKSGDTQTLAQIAAIETQTSLGGTNVYDIELGWLVTPAAYGGGPDPKLFVFVRDNQKYGTNGCLVHKTSTGWTCGFQQLDATHYPGKDLLSAVGSVKKFSIFYSSGNWFIQYGTNRIGYIPESAFSGSFNSITQANWQGEVLVASDPPTTQMGNGTCGTATLSQNVPAHFYNMTIASATQSYPAYTYSQTYFVSNKNYYNGIYNYYKDTKTTLAYGGPTGCP